MYLYHKILLFSGIPVCNTVTIILKKEREKMSIATIIVQRDDKKCAVSNKYITAWKNEILNLIRNEF